MTDAAFAPTLTLAALETSIVAILGDDAGQHRRPTGGFYWSDAVFRCAEHCFMTKRPDDAASETVRQALAMLDEDLELPSSVS